MIPATKSRGAARRRRLFVPPALFAVILAAFVLPFVTVSCDGETVHATGLQLATGNVPDANGLACVETDGGTGFFFDPVPPADTSPSCNTAQQVQNEGTPFALVALFCAIAGFGLSFVLLTGHLLRERSPFIIVTLVGGGSLGIGLVNGSLSNADVQFEPGFWIAYLLFIVLFWGHVFGLFQTDRRGRPPSDPSSADPLLPPGAIPRL